jgi:hypothetical protein
VRTWLLTVGSSTPLGAYLQANEHKGLFRGGWPYQGA